MLNPSVVRHATFRECFAEFYQVELSDLEEGTICCESEDGKQSEVNVAELEEGMIPIGIHGFCCPGDNSIHVWITPDASDYYIQRFASHELGHLYEEHLKQCEGEKFAVKLEELFADFARVCSILRSYISDEEGNDSEGAESSYKVEICSIGCHVCGHGTTYGVTHLERGEEVMESTTFEDRSVALDLANRMNAAYKAGKEAHDAIES